MRRVYKYGICYGLTETLLPKHAEILSIGSQGGNICMWAKVDDTVESELRKFFTTFTGRAIPDNEYLLDFIGTTTTDDGLVYHVFEVKDTFDNIVKNFFKVDDEGIYDEGIYDLIIKADK